MNVSSKIVSVSYKEVPKKFKKYIDGKLAHLSHADRKIIESVLIKYVEVFHDDEDSDFNSTGRVVHKTEAGGAAAIWKAPYKTPYVLRQEKERQVQKTLDKSVIRPRYYPWSVPVVLLPKKIEKALQSYVAGRAFGKTLQNGGISGSTHTHGVTTKIVSVVESPPVMPLQYKI
jgi:hypothetical protein